MAYIGNKKIITRVVEGGSYNQGYDKGYDSGYTAGKVEGESIGYNNGFTVGKTEGETIGYNIGYKDGKTEGHNEGYESGKSDVIATIGAELDRIIAIQEELLGGSGTGGDTGDSGDTGNDANLITFTAKNYHDDPIYTLQAEEGMTWGEWCESEYNTIGAYVNAEQGNAIYIGVCCLESADENYGTTECAILSHYVVVSDKYIWI